MKDQAVVPSTAKRGALSRPWNRIAVLLPLLAALACGCRTAAMKGTPFFTGEHASRLGPAEDRVNLWPLVYWRDPALSVLWPIGEWADDRIAVRPFFSRYRERPGGPYTETNILWPIGHFDAEDGGCRIFPYFWGRARDGGSHHVLFPFFWDFREPGGDSGCNAFFPLWIHSWSHSADWSETDILWPVFRRESGPHADSVHLFPLFGHSRDPASGFGSDWALAGLAGRWKDARGEAYWLAPLFYRDMVDDEFWTLFWSGSLGGDERWWLLPLFLSGGRYRTDGSDSFALLAAGLAGWERSGRRPGRNWLLPLWYRDGGNLFTLPYARWKEFDDTEYTWFTPLVGTRRGRRSGSWFFPLWDWADGPEGSYDRSFLLLAGASRHGGETVRRFFPVWWRRACGIDPASLAAEAAASSLPDGDWDMPRADPADPSPSPRRESPGWAVSGSRQTGWLFGLAGARSSASRHPEDPGCGALSVKARRETDFVLPDAAGATENGAPLVRYDLSDSNWFFPFWDSETTRGAAFDPATGECVVDGATEDFSLLWFLYDCRRESVSADGHEYVRRRVLWRLYHDEILDGDRSVDVFPFIGIDRRKDGYRKISFLWRFFRWERDPAKGTSLDVLFLPLRRPSPP